MLITTSSTGGGYFEKFMKGNNIRTDVIRRVSFALSLEDLHALLDTPEKDWE